MKVNYNKLSNKENRGWIIWDAFMIGLIFINLGWMIFELAFLVPLFRDLVHYISPSIHDFYAEAIHPQYYFYDLIFVSIFITEFVIRWIIAIVRKTYDTWLAFPFVYWYDIIGCIPFGSLRFLRLLRIISLMIRLQKREVVDFTDTWWYIRLNKYYRIFVEELSDRVAVNILSGVQKEIIYNDDTMVRIIDEIMKPRRNEIVLLITKQINNVVLNTYLAHREDLQEYVLKTVNKAVENNEEVATLEKIPVVGKQISKALKSSIADITFGVIEEMMKDLAKPEYKAVVDASLNIGLNQMVASEHDAKLKKVSQDLTNEIIELVKEQVSKKHYKKDFPLGYRD